MELASGKYIKILKQAFTNRVSSSLICRCINYPVELIKT